MLKKIGYAILGVAIMSALWTLISCLLGSFIGKVIIFISVILAPGIIIGWICQAVIEGENYYEEDGR